MPPNTWVEAFFSEYLKCDLLLKNTCEVFNKYILEARELPIMSKFEKIKCHLMTRIVNKQNEMKDKFQGPLCPKIRKKILRRSEWANLCYALPAGHGVFQVNERDNQYIVELATKHCDCRRWDLTGIPCNHAIAALRHERIPAESVVPACYSVDSFNKAYEFNIWPCRDQREWEHVNGPQVGPPVYEKKVGRPKKSRRKQPYEVQGKNGPKMTKNGVVMHCRYCQSDQHNQATYELKKLGLRPKQQPKRKHSLQVDDAAQPSFEAQYSYEFYNDASVPQGSSQFLSQMSTTMLSQMTQEVIST